MGAERNSNLFDQLKEEIFLEKMSLRHIKLILNGKSLFGASIFVSKISLTIYSPIFTLPIQAISQKIVLDKSILRLTLKLFYEHVTYYSYCAYVYSPSIHFGSVGRFFFTLMSVEHAQNTQNFTMNNFQITTVRKVDMIESMEFAERNHISAQFFQHKWNVLKMSQF